MLKNIILVDQGESELNPFSGVSAPRSPGRLPQTLGVDEIADEDEGAEAAEAK